MAKHKAWPECGKPPDRVSWCDALLETLAVISSTDFPFGFILFTVTTRSGRPPAESLYLPCGACGARMLPLSEWSNPKIHGMQPLHFPSNVSKCFAEKFCEGNLM